MNSIIGKRLEGRYLIERLVGIGGMANVYKATDLRTNQPVAVKILKEEFMQNAELVQRFKNESKAISILDHPNIVKVYDVSVTDRLQYIVMEYVDGITLKEYLKHVGHPLSWTETIRIIEQLLNALQHAHGKGVIHRDIKPQNIMLLADSSLKVMDFGIARISLAETYAESGNKAIGSVQYISPEQASGGVTDARSDIYSIGIMMYEMLSGHVPFEGDDAVKVAIRQISEKPVPLSEVVSDLPEALYQIVEKAMSKKPEQRYKNAAEMLEAIEIFKLNPSVSFAYKYLNDSESTIRKTVQNLNENNSTMSEKVKEKKKKVPKSKKKRTPFGFILPLMFGLAVAFACGSAILCYMIFTNSTNPLFSTKENVDLVNFVGMSRSEIENNDKYSCFKIKFDPEYNSNVDEGIVYNQTPKPPREVKEGQTVTLKVSLGTLWVKVPEISNYSQKDAEELLKEKGLSVIVRRTVDENTPVGTVIKTDPVAGEKVASGDSVIVYVSQAKVETDRTVPQVVGLTMGDVQTLLRNSNLSVGTITEQYSDSYPEGTIIDQSPAFGLEVKMNTKVNLVISIGPEPEEEEDDEDEDDEDEDEDEDEDDRHDEDHDD